MAPLLRSLANSKASRAASSGSLCVMIARAIITHRLPLDAAREAFQLARDRKSGAIKVVLEP